MHQQNKFPTPDDINNIISAEIPAETDDKQLHHLVKTHMIHGPCGLANRSSPCMKMVRALNFSPKIGSLKPLSIKMDIPSIGEGILALLF
jgi:hypothetical protein